MQQAPGVGVGRVVMHSCGVADFEDLTGVHDRDPVSDLEQEREVMSDEQDRESEPLL